MKDITRRLKSWISRTRLSNLLSQRTAVRRVIINAVWLGFDRILGIANSLLVGAWIARYLGPEQFGVYSYALTFLALFTPISELGLTALVVRSLVEEPDKKYNILGTTFLLQLIGGTFAFVLCVSAAFVQEGNSSQTFIMIAVASIRLVFTCGTLVEYWFHSLIQSKYVVLVRIAVLIVVIAVKVVSVLLLAPLMIFVVISVAESLLLIVGMLVAYRKSGQHFGMWRIDLVEARRLLGDSWPLFISSLAIGVYVRIDKVILGILSGPESVGIYSAAVLFVEAWYFVPAVIATSVFPLIIQTSQIHSKDIYRKRMQYLYDTMAAIGYLLTIPLIAFSRTLVEIVFGSAYASAGPFLAVYALSLIFTFLGTARGKWLVVENLNRTYMITVVIGAFVNIGLNYALIPKFGALGAAWATVVSYATSAYLSCAIWPALRPVFRQMTFSLLIPFRIKAIWRMLNASP